MIRFLIFLIFVIAARVNCVLFHLPPNSQKCLQEDIHANQLVIGEYEISDALDQVVDYIIRDSKGQLLSRKENITKGKFSFMFEIYQTYEICFISKVSLPKRGISHEVSIITKKGVETKNYAGIAEASKIKPLEVDLKRLEDLVDAIVTDFALMRTREEEMRNTNEKTNSRILFFNIFSMCCLFGLATWQTLYLRSYFKSKKLIE